MIGTSNPGHHRTVVESNHQFEVHLDLASGTDDHPQKIWRFIARCHAVNERRRSAFRLKFGLENKRSFAIAPPNASDRFRG